MIHPWHAVPMVLIPVARCPECGQPPPHILIRTQTENDGSICRRSICKRCSTRFLVIIDPDLPAVGNIEGDAF